MSDAGTNRLAQAKALSLKIIDTLRRDGIASVVRRSASELRRLNARESRPRGFDREFATDTAGIIPLWKLNIDSPNKVQGVRYQASDARMVREAINLLPVRLQEFIFVDVGSGKGKPLLVASEYPFKRVVGIEFSTELHQIATENIQKYKSRSRCSDVRSVCADAVAHPLPKANLILFLYNPFGPDVMASFLQKLEAEVRPRGRRVYLIYHGPEHADLIEQSGLFERLDLPETIYRLLPPA